jgi:hypothetical protein
MVEPTYGTICNLSKKGIVIPLSVRGHVSTVANAGLAGHKHGAAVAPLGLPGAGVEHGPIVSIRPAGNARWILRR